MDDFASDDEDGDGPSASQRSAGASDHQSGKASEDPGKDSDIVMMPEVIVDVSVDDQDRLRDYVKRHAKCASIRNAWLTDRDKLLASGVSSSKALDDEDDDEDVDDLDEADSSPKLAVSAPHRPSLGKGPLWGPRSQRRHLSDDDGEEDDNVDDIVF